MWWHQAVLAGNILRSAALLGLIVFNAFFKGKRIVRNRLLYAGRIQGIKTGHSIEQQGYIFGSTGQRPPLIEARGKGDHAITGVAAIRGFKPGDAA
jgi:hypothetical protein